MSRWREPFTLPLWRVTIAFLLVVGVSVWGLWNAHEATQTAQDALASADARGSRAAALISELNDKISELQGELRALSEASAEERAALATKIDALTAQVEGLGGDPVVSSGGSPTPAPTTPTTTRCRVSHPVTGLCIVR